MSQRKTKGNLNFGRRDNAPSPAVNNYTSATNTPTMATNIPNSTIAPVSSNLEATLPVAPTYAAIPRSSNLIAAPLLKERTLEETRI